MALQYTIIRGKEERTPLLNAIFQERHPFFTLIHLEISWKYLSKQLLKADYEDHAAWMQNTEHLW